MHSVVVDEQRTGEVAGLRALLNGSDVAMVMLSVIFYQNKPQSDGSL